MVEMVDSLMLVIVLLSWLLLRFRKWMVNFTMFFFCLESLGSSIEMMLRR